METIHLIKKNEVYMKVECDYGILLEMSEHFSFYADNYKFMKAYKQGTWDGKIRLVNLRAREMYIGLYDAVLEFAKPRGYKVICETNQWGTVGETYEVNPDEIENFVSDLKITDNKGKFIDPYDYQVTALKEIIKDQRGLIISPTSSGKSLMMYMIARWFQDYELQNGDKIVIVVPTVALVEQLSKDFGDYSSASDWNVEDNVHKIYSGKKKSFLKDITVTTWQSLINMKKDSLSAVKCIIGDEAHTFGAKELTKLLESFHNTYWRIGTTGTLHDSKVNSLVLEGLFGRIRKLTTTKELQRRGTVSDIDIKCINFEYPESVRKTFRKDYHQEISFINTFEQRNKFIKNLALDIDGNTLIMFRFVEHGKVIYDLIREAAHKNRKVFLVYGGTDVDSREEVRSLVEGEKDAIIVASLGVFSTGVNIKNIHNIIFAAPSKSKIKVMQSIGRGLRLSDDRRNLTLYDLVDNLSWRGKSNFALRHAAKRLEMYAVEDFKYKIFKVKFKEVI